VLTKYLHAAPRRATYEILPDGEGFYGEIPGFDGVWANAPTLAECREGLQEVLEGWLLLGLSHGHPLPTIDGLDLSIHKAAARGRRLARLSTPI
jgi:predicted RNase H-like HicB family nuclease